MKAFNLSEYVWANRRIIVTAHDYFRMETDHEDVPQLPKVPENKGIKGKNCNRTCCQKSGAVWYNLSTRAYYCAACSLAINEANMMDSLKLYDTPFLCVPPDHEQYPS